METCQGEAFLCERKADLPKRERCSPHPPSPPLSKKHVKSTQQMSVTAEQHDPQSLVPSTPPTISPGLQFLCDSRGHDLGWPAMADSMQSIAEQS